MKHLLHPLFALLASVTRQDLARQVAYLKEENRILRSRLPKQVNVTPKERQLLIKFGRKLGAQLKELISIVSYGSFLRWIREASGQTPVPVKRKPGRPKTPDEIQELVLKLARENSWGYTRILGELRKLGIRKICRQTVKNILKAHGLDLGPERGKGAWDGGDTEPARKACRVGFNVRHNRADRLGSTAQSGLGDSDIFVPDPRAMSRI